MMKQFVFVSLALSLVAGASAVNLVQNGGFETVNTAVNNGSGSGYWTFNAGSASIANWGVGERSVDIVTNPYAHFGTKGLDLVGSPGPGSVFQTLSTTAGLTHVVTFKAQWTSGTANQSVRVSLGAAPTQTISIGPTAGVWYDQTVTFTNVVGSSNLFTLATLANNTGNGNTFIDEVSVSPVPEPFTMALAGSALVLAARRRRRS